MRGPCPRGCEDCSLQDPSFQPAFDEASELGKRIELGEERGVIDLVETVFDVSLQHILRGVLDAEENGSDRIMGGTPRPEPIGVGFKLGFPFGLQRR